MQDRAMFVFRHGERFEKARVENVVAIGWHRLESLEGSWEELKARLSAAYPELYGGKSRSVGNAAGSVWRFARDMKEGDYILMPVDSAFYVAEVAGSYNRRADWANSSDDMAWYRPAKWIAGPLPRTDVSNALQMRLKSRQTIVAATDCLADVDSLLAGKRPPQFLAAVQERTREVVIKTLRERANSDQLERIVAALFIAQGAESSEVQPKNSKKPGDFDVIARWPDAGSVQGLRIAAQIKHHTGESGAEGVQQLIERFRHEQSVDRLVFVTTAESVSDRAVTLAAEEGITILTQGDLADWLLSVGLGALRSTN